MKRLYLGLLLVLLSCNAVAAQFFTDFDEFATGACSSNLTGFTVQDIGTWSCNITDTGSGDHVARLTDGAAGNDLTLVTYDAYETSGALEVVVKISLDTTADQNAPIGAALIASNGQAWAWRPTGTPTSTTWRISLFAANGDTSGTNACAAISFTEPSGDFWVLIGIDASDNVYGSLWADGDSRPGSPMCSGNSSALSTVKPGFIAFDSSDDPIDIKAFGAGTGGDAAPESGGGGPDDEPDPFSFVDQTGVGLSTTITSAAVTITGIDAQITCSATGGTIDLNLDGNFQASQDVNVDDEIRARHTSSASNSTAVNTPVDCGGVSDTFTSTTEAESSSIVPIIEHYRRQQQR